MQNANLRPNTYTREKRKMKKEKALQKKNEERKKLRLAIFLLFSLFFCITSFLFSFVMLSLKQGETYAASTNHDP